MRAEATTFAFDSMRNAPMLLAFVTIGGPSGSTTYVCRGGTVTLVFLGERLAWPLSRYDKVITAG